MSDFTPEELRRRPWIAYPVRERPSYMTNEQAIAWHGEEPFIVRWTIPSMERLDYGWKNIQRTFADEVSARAAAEANMGIARSVELVRWSWDNGNRAQSIYRRKAQKRKAA